MKRILRTKLQYWLIASIIFLIFSCNQKPESDTHSENNETSNLIVKNTNETTQEFKDYWYSGNAEITSYKLEQARYGEIRDGHAVLIYVTEDFNSEKQVKADNQNSDNVSVLKLNATKKFNTGIYPYSIMQSTFYPISNKQHALKVTSSMQEWCGHVYAQLNNRNKFEVTSHSYFESESDQVFKLDKAILENELWTQLRIDPSSLPEGELMIIPSFEYGRMKHVDIKPYKAEATYEGNLYTLNYPELNRTLTIHFNHKFPYDILGWEESFKSGFGENAKQLTTKATKLTSIKSKYWSKNSNADENLRKTLEIE